MFVLNNGVISHKWRDNKTGKWSVLVPFPGGGFTSVSVMKNNNGDLELFATDHNGHLQHTWQKTPGGEWFAWQPV